MLANTANHALSKNTWSSYKTAVNMLEKCSKETGSLMKFPLNEEKILIFIGWLLNRGLSAATLNSYLSGIRQAHLAAGVLLPSLRSPVVNQIIQGATNLDALKRRNQLKPKRLPVTPTVLKLIKAELRSSTFATEDQRLIWAVCLLAFMGCFRIHELLSRKATSFDPNYDLLGRDLNLKSIIVGKSAVKTITVKIKSEKTDRVGRETIVDVYSNDGPFCPVRALEKWQKISKLDSQSLPAFRLASGQPLTGRHLNKILKSLLGNHLDYSRGGVSCHSFRAGLASLMGSLGYTDEQIQAIGRWSSNAYNVYVKLPRTRRLQMAKVLGKLNL